MNFEEQQLRLLQPNRSERRRAVAIFADDPQISLRLAVFAQGALARLLVIDDDDVQHASANSVASRR